MLCEMFHLTFADKFLLAGNLLQQMERVLKRFLCFGLAWFAEKEVDLETFPRIVQRHAAAKPAVCFFANAVWINQIKGDRLIEMPDVVLPRKMEIVLIILCCNCLFRKLCCNL